MKQTIRIEYRGRTGAVELPPPPEALSIGSKPGCTVVVKDPAVDGVHLEISATPGGVRVRDCGTKNGTRLNGALVSQALLGPGDEVRIGDVRITLGAPAAPSPVPPSPKRPASAPKPPPAPKRPAPPAAAPVPGRAPAAGPAGGESDTAARPPAAPVTTARAGARVRRGRRSPALVLLPVLAVAAVGAYLLFFTGETDADRAEHLYQTAVATRQSGDREAARKELLALVERYPASAAATRAKRTLGEIEAEYAHEKEAWEARRKLKDRRKSETLADFERDWEQFRKQYEGTAAASDESFLDEARKEYRQEAAERFRQTKQRADALADQARWYDATLVWLEYLSIPGNVPPDEAGASREFRRLKDRAQTAWEQVDRQTGKLIDEKKYDEASSLLAARQEEFRNTRHAFDLRQQLELIDILRNREGGAEAPAAAKVEVDKREEYLRGAEKAEDLVRQRRYGEAVAAFRKLADACPYPKLAGEFRGRAEDLAGYATVFTDLRAQIGEHPERFKGLDLGGGFRANATAATDEDLVVKLRGSEVRLSWSRMSSPRLLTLLVRMQVEPAEKLEIGRFAFEAGDAETGNSWVSAALKADQSLKDRAFAILARAKKVPIPDGGFVCYRDEWMTPTERDAAVLRDRIRDAEKAADSSDPTRRDAGLATLRGLGDPAKDALVRALSFQLSSTVTALYHLPVLRDPGTKASLYAELGKRRKAALDLIFDEKKYPYPHPEGPAYEKVQAEVVQLVDAVREVWETPVSLLADGNEDLRSDLDLAQKYASELTELGHPPDPSFEAVCATLNDSIGLKRYAPGGTEKSALEWNDDVLAYNRAVDIDAGPEERACVDALNDYRIMMGRRAVKWNAKLLEAARGHSKEMHDLKYFAHSCPFPGPEHDAHRNPSDRARQAGYGGGVSENIAMGSNTGKGAFLQWFGSSGHHRNMLGKGHTEVGVGRVDVYWTQNFGSASRTVNVPRGGRKQN